MNSACILCNICCNEQNLEYDKHIIDTENFFVLAAMGQMCEGYLLICCREHINNMTLLNPAQWDELKMLKERIRRLVFNTYKHQAVMFEHGDASNTIKGGSCITHAHIHVVPVSINSHPEFLNQFELEFFSEYDDFKNAYRGKAPYFYLELSNRQIIAFQEYGLPCQFGRQLIHKESGLKEHWDWRINPTKEKMLLTIAKYNEVI